MSKHIDAVLRSIDEALADNPTGFPTECLVQDGVILEQGATRLSLTKDEARTIRFAAEARRLMMLGAARDAYEASAKTRLDWVRYVAAAEVARTIRDIDPRGND